MPSWMWISIYRTSRLLREWYIPTFHTPKFKYLHLVAYCLEEFLKVWPDSKDMDAINLELEDEDLILNLDFHTCPWSINGLTNPTIAIYSMHAQVYLKYYHIFYWLSASSNTKKFSTKSICAQLSQKYKNRETRTDHTQSCYFISLFRSRFRISDVPS